ncbi:hypothetical protein J7T55_013885 [Diaporthe amygdali]|uniref:uncharacterized protein n=1 Tax=Phomopsis amygdali TaxID=1214568 RepID=UPI0022FE56A6|nr:uncharacterized protein J7T55_013885 [Diaporthe amygdali]KAJ0119682.1 hypothetical protein J7T55_013885 [Diaporthe amygdali]
MGDNDPVPDAASLMGNLIDEFRSALDESLIIAIVGDFDLTLQFDEARGILQGLSQDAEAEEASRFIAGGGDGQIDDLAALGGNANTNSSHSTSGSKPCTDVSSRTDFSDTLSEQFELLDLPQDVDVLALDEDGKIAELKTMFPLLKDMDIKFCLRKADGDFTKACEELLSTQFLEENGRSGVEMPKEKAGKARLDVGYRLKPLDLDAEDKAASSPVSPALTASRPLTRRSSLPRLMPSSSASTSAPNTPATKSTTEWQTVQSAKPRKTYSELASDAAAARALTSQSFSAANAAYRRGKSDALFRPVAGVLAERAREQLDRSRAAQSASYEALVDENSSAGHIDLHGVPVADGVRMALERTQAWWAGLGEDRARRARDEGFTVVTGLGNHSSKGVSRLRQDVGAALKRAGWRVRTETGQFVVTGKV